MTRLDENTTEAAPITGVGTNNTAFLRGAGGGPNANAAQVFATFWIETVKGAPGQPDFLQLQYTQTVILNFNGLSWPHVTVGTLRKKAAINVPIPWIDPKIPPNILQRIHALEDPTQLHLTPVEMKQ